MKRPNRRFIGLLVVVCTLLGGACILWSSKERLVANWITAKAVEAFPGAEVSIGRMRLGFSYLQLDNVQVKDSYRDVHLKKTTVRFSIPELIKGRLSEIALDGVTLEVQGGGIPAPLVGVGSSKGSGSPGGLRRLVVRDASFFIRTDLLDLQGSLSLEANLAHRIPKSLTADIEAFRFRGFTLKGLRVHFNGEGGGDLSVREALYQKITMTDVAGPIRIAGGYIVVDPLKASVFGGTLNGKAALNLHKPYDYDLLVQVEQVGLAALITNFKFDDKVGATGVLAGALTVSGNRDGIALIRGEVNDMGKGGDLVIRDQAFLQNISDRTKQPIELIEASLKDYHFDSGAVGLSKTDRSLVLSMKLDGAKGARHLETEFHDIF